MPYKPNSIEGYRDEENPHEPTNVPENLEDLCHRVFEHVETWSHDGATKFVYPKTEEGYNDYRTMLDCIGAEEGVILKDHSRNEHLLVRGRIGVDVKWGEKYRVEDGGLQVLVIEENESRYYVPENGYTVKSLWQAYIYGDVEVVGDVLDLVRNIE